MSTDHNTMFSPFASWSAGRPTFLASLILLVFAGPIAVAQGPNTGGDGRADATSGESFQSLFDGETLEGWDGDQDHWRVEQGAIVGEIPPGTTLNKNTWLVWRGGELADFDLRFQFRLTGAPAANSGVQIRAQVDSVDHVSGYQADMDQGETWLGRIYDEHGRALLAERGTRTHIAPDGTKSVQTLAPAHQYAVLFRERAWNDYRVVGVGGRIAVYVNGTLFCDLLDEQEGEWDPRGSLAFQLHSGPETKIELREIRLRALAEGENPLGEFPRLDGDGGNAPSEDEGTSPVDAEGNAANFDFETGDLAGWTATGDAFASQPLRDDGIAQRWSGQTSGKQGDYFIAGYEIVQDAGVGTLVSSPVTVSHPYASFLIGGGAEPTTRVEVVRADETGQPAEVIAQASGENREQMRRVTIDLRAHQGQTILVRLVDESTGGWGHLNFDDFRFHDQPPSEIVGHDAGRTTSNPLLQHLVANPGVAGGFGTPAAGADTVAQMFLPKGFSAEVIAAEPDLYQPMAFSFDERGRLWVVEGNCYPQKRPEGEGIDRILIFADEDGDGRYESRKVFCEGLNLVSGMALGYGGVWIGAAPHLLFIPDRDRDDVPDGEPQVLLDGFSFADTHETINSFMWGPDGWLYGNQGIFNMSLVGKPGTPDEERTKLTAGVWRYHPTRHTFEIFAHGGSNQWGLDYDDHGQIFITHCRSFWGGGPTTHVIQGGHYWNQVNSGYAPFIVADPPREMPWMRTYMLASARYGHGEGGAGKRGSREVYGGHSHVGAMIYLGDNWPAEYRNHLFTHNLHGHQINHQINRREAGGFNTVHAGYDVLMCADPRYIAVDLKYGPDGAVYISDWYDIRHCHSPTAEQWDRGNGRIYRVQFDPAYRPVSVDYSLASDAELVAAQLHENDWHVRTARRILGERALHRAIAPEAVDRLRALLSHADETRRLRALWALHAIGQLDGAVLDRALLDPSEYVRGWGIQLAVEALPENEIEPRIAGLLDREDSLLVRRYLASAVTRVSSDLGWRIVETLGAQTENAEDRELPLLVWYAAAQLMDQDLQRGLAWATAARLPMLADYAYWYAARTSDAGRAAIMQRIVRTTTDAHARAERQRLLRLMELATRGMRGVTEPPGWSEVGPALYEAESPEVRQLAERLGAVFGDQALFASVRRTLADPSASVEARRHALRLLENDDSPEGLPVLLELLDHAELAPQVIPALVRYDAPRIPAALLERMPEWDAEKNAAAMEVLSSRAAWSEAVLDAIADEALPREHLTAYYARQMSNLGSEHLTARLEKEWGALGQSSEELREEIAGTVRAYQEAPLWAFSADAGQIHYKNLCASCHQTTNEGENIAPNLAGTGSKGIEYIIENVLDPNAVIGRDFQARVVLTVEGRVINGLIQQETPTAVTIRTANNTVTVPKDDIEQIQISPNSFMPEGLLKTLDENQKIELFKYLMSM